MYDFAEAKQLLIHFVDQVVGSDALPVDRGKARVSF